MVSPRTSMGNFMVGPFNGDMAFPGRVIRSFGRRGSCVGLGGRAVRPNSPVDLNRPGRCPVSLVTTLVGRFDARPAMGTTCLHLVRRGNRGDCFVIISFFNSVRDAFSTVDGITGPFLSSRVRLSVVPCSVSFTGGTMGNIRPFCEGRG